ncbi:PREDICTED: nuclear respiratory factor 1-like [Acropora digitifera]|uniref:nuclear respiratory factor 1-like n=1 Tax=Acropora digitifera TaxID=70779 RepID=UPI00077A9F7C|nr:PREDICTED: nuclear respiratory factor 1-like [Acropora digitifera]XP_015776741.1 PREDICTED: nuclear respiratory factor 1-like [Acropora digitifera]XP_029190219.1 nuclear respiratory factor 1-like [Acropora millepora]XP_029190220.1 nuclear respiratory factor 1-like [Acropora millepora]
MSQTIHSMSQMSDDEPSSPESTTFDGSDLLSSTVSDEVTAQLAAAGPVGVAAAAAIATGKKRKRPHSFETNPSIRKRQQTRLLRKLRATIDEYTTRVGQQAVVLCVCPGKPNPLFKVFGAVPLENVVRNIKQLILQDLEHALTEHAPPPPPENPDIYTLPPLVIDGIPTPVDKMTQAQLRAFIPMMLRYSTGRGKPGWGKDSTRPAWWPSDLPWQNVRSDCRSEDEKARISWTNALRQIVKNCYKYHGREDLLPAFSDGEASQHQYVQQTHQMVHTISNADGTVSLIQVDASGAVSTLSDAATSQTEATQAVATLAEVAAATQVEVTLTQPGQGGDTVTIEQSELSHTEAIAQAAVATLAEATLADGGQIVLPEHAAAAAAALANVQDNLNTSNMVTIPVQAAASLMQIQTHHLPVSSHSQYMSASVPQVAMAPHSMPQTATTSAVGGHDDNTHMVVTCEGVPVATQAVEVVTLENAQDPMN